MTNFNTNEQYKGFSIAFRSNGVTIDSGRYFVKAEGFNPEGYATLNNAKGAITKHLKAAESQNSVFVESVINLKTAPVPAVAVVPVRESRNKREGRYAGKFAAKQFRVPKMHRGRVAFLPSVDAALDAAYKM